MNTRTLFFVVACMLNFSFVQGQVYPGRPVDTPKLGVSEAAYFLSQATWRTDWESLEELQWIGKKKWLERQAEQQASYLEENIDKWGYVSRQVFSGEEREEMFVPNHSFQQFQLALAQKLLIAEDPFRQRIALAFHESFLPQNRTSYQDIPADIWADYYDGLIRYSLGNCRELLQVWMKHPTLGVYGAEEVFRTKFQESFSVDVQAFSGTDPDELDQLFMHPYMGVFVAKTLIQQLITPKPSPEYISRIAEVFEDNGEGVRGDLLAVSTAILLDTAARSEGDKDLSLNRSLLYEPLFSYTDLCLHIEETPLGVLSASSKTRTSKSIVSEESLATGEMSLDIFSSDYVLESAELAAYTYPIEPTQVILNFMSEVEAWTSSNDDFTDLHTYEEKEAQASKDLTQPQNEWEVLMSLAENPASLLEHLNLVLMHGQLSWDTQRIIVEAVGEIKEREERLHLALYLMFISPENRWMR